MTTSPTSCHAIGLCPQTGELVVNGYAVLSPGRDLKQGYASSVLVEVGWALGRNREFAAAIVEIVARQQRNQDLANAVRVSMT
jgi:hypothetical protein